MKKIEALNLEDALTLASKEFNCSIVDLEYEIIQNPSKGFFGFGKKNAIICVETKTPNNTQKLESISKNFNPKNEKNYEKETKEELEKTQKKDLHTISQKIKQELKELLELLPYEIKVIKVEPIDDNMLYIKVDGADSALLIGKEGYRYKALSYLLFNWINYEYGLMIRLEIAEFLKNQEEMIANYLIPTVTLIENEGRAQTKPFDGVLAHIALKQLRQRFPNKYVSFRINSDGERYIIINDFLNS